MSMGMRSASRRALTELRERQQSVLGETGTSRALAGLADELYAIADLLVGQPRLRRNLGDPATEAESRVGVVNQLLSGKVSDGALKITKAAVALRWSSPWDLTDALEMAGDEALFAAAEQDNILDTIEDELFRIERILDGSGDLAGLLDEQSAPAERRAALLDGLVDGKVTPVTRQLLRHAVGSQRKRSVTLAIDDLLEQAAARQQRSVARVISAAPLTDQQQTRLAAALSDLYGRKISLRSAIDPAVQGGLVVRVGDEVIDGSVAARLAETRSALAS
jgi:F-type H+-transporting ATPase subunit delta